MKYEIKKGDVENLLIHSIQEYSENFLSVKAGEIYKISCASDQRWNDWFIRSTPAGYFNPFANLLGLLRKRKTKCFCLCGIYDKREKQTAIFPIGMMATVEVPANCSVVHFFANDIKGFFYKNNSGTITIRVERLH